MRRRVLVRAPSTEGLVDWCATGSPYKQYALSSRATLRRRVRRTWMGRGVEGWLRRDLRVDAVGTWKWCRWARERLVKTCGGARWDWGTRDARCVRAAHDRLSQRLVSSWRVRAALRCCQIDCKTMVMTKISEVDQQNAQNTHDIQTRPQRFEGHGALFRRLTSQNSEADHDQGFAEGGA